MSNESETRPANGADGLIAGILDVMVGLSLAICHYAQIEPAALAASMVQASESTITALTPPEYAVGRRYAAERIAQTLRGLGLPKQPQTPVRPGFEVILGGLAGVPKPDVSNDREQPA
jgi:hypothetical protein